MDISTQHCAEDKAKVSSFLFGCVGRISYILESWKEWVKCDYM